MKCLEGKVYLTGGKVVYTGQPLVILPIFVVEDISRLRGAVKTIIPSYVWVPILRKEV
jgi:hypothetical protein